MAYIPTQRNFSNIQFAELRDKIDHDFNACHDELSDCFYNKKPFLWKGKDYGVLDKETFDELHGLIFHLREVKFHEENLKLPKEKQIPTDKYDSIKDSSGKIIEEKHKVSNDKIISLKNEGIEIDI